MGRWFGVLFFSALSLAAPSSEELYQRYEKLDKQGPSTKEFLSRKEQHDLLLSVSRDAVTCLESVCHYDPTFEIRFSFGRAMAVHLLARAQGLKPESIRKVLAVGDLHSKESGEWRFQVATAVRAEDRSWWVIDPDLEPPTGPGSALPLEQWIGAVQKAWDTKRNAKFYLVDRGVILPDVRKVPIPSKETGKYLIETSFHPASKPGFRRHLAGRKPYFAVELAAEREYFTRVDEPILSDRFSFLGATTNGRYLDFRGYFSDLFKELEESPPVLEKPEGIERPNLPKVGTQKVKSALGE